MGAEKEGRREFMKKIPLFGAGLALGLSALADSGETPKAKKIQGEEEQPQGVCDTGTCNVGKEVDACNVGTCSVGS